jgi:WD repeat-containing protein 48
VYRGAVAATGVDTRVLEDVMPMWLLEYLITNKVPNAPIVKVGFVLLPYPAKESDEQLPELLNMYAPELFAKCLLTNVLCSSQSKLTASRFLRVRKLTSHVGASF